MRTSWHKVLMYDSWTWMDNASWMLKRWEVITYFDGKICCDLKKILIGIFTSHKATIQVFNFLNLLLFIGIQRGAGKFQNYSPTSSICQVLPWEARTNHHQRWSLWHQHTLQQPQRLLFGSDTAASRSCWQASKVCHCNWHGCAMVRCSWKQTSRCVEKEVH